MELEPFDDKRVKSRYNYEEVRINTYGYFADDFKEIKQAIENKASGSYGKLTGIVIGEDRFFICNHSLCFKYFYPSNK